MSEVHVLRSRRRPPPANVYSWLEDTWILGSRHKLDLFGTDTQPMRSWILKSFTLERNGEIKLDYDLEFLSVDSPSNSSPQSQSIGLESGSRQQPGLPHANASTNSGNSEEQRPNNLGERASYSPYPSTNEPGRNYHTNSSPDASSVQRDRLFGRYHKRRKDPIQLRPSSASPDLPSSSSRIPESLPSEPLPDILNQDEDRIMVNNAPIPFSRSLENISSVPDPERIFYDEDKLLPLSDELSSDERDSPLKEIKTEGNNNGNNGDEDRCGNKIAESKKHPSIVDESDSAKTKLDAILSILKEQDDESYDSIVGFFSANTLKRIEIAAQETMRIGDSDFLQLNRELLGLPVAEVKFKNTNTSTAVPDYSSRRSSQLYEVAEDMTVSSKSQKPVLQHDAQQEQKMQQKRKQKKDKEFTEPLLVSENGSGFPEPTEIIIPMYETVKSPATEDSSDQPSQVYSSTSDWNDTASVTSGTDSVMSMFSVAPTVEVGSAVKVSSRFQASAGGTWRLELGSSTSMSALLRRHIAHVRKIKKKKDSEVRSKPIPLGVVNGKHADHLTRSQSHRSKPFPPLTWMALSRRSAFLLFLDIVVMGVPMSFSLLVRVRSGIKKLRQRSLQKILANENQRQKGGLFHRFMSNQKHYQKTAAPRIPFASSHPKDILTMRLLYGIEIPHVESTGIEEQEQEEPEPESCLIPEEIRTITRTSHFTGDYSALNNLTSSSDVSISTLPSPWESVDPNLRSLAQNANAHVTSSSNSLNSTRSVVYSENARARSSCCGHSRNNPEDTSMTKFDSGGANQHKPSKDSKACWCGPKRRVTRRESMANKGDAGGAVTVISVDGVMETELGLSNKLAKVKKGKTKLQWAPGSLVGESSDEEEKEEEEETTQRKEKSGKNYNTSDLENSDAYDSNDDKDNEVKNQSSEKKGKRMQANDYDQNESFIPAYTLTRHRAHFVRYFV